MRDLRLSFWSSIHGCAGLVMLLVSRLLSVYLITNPVRSVCFLDPLNYLLTFGSILLFLRATALASASIKKLRTGKKLLMAIQLILGIDLLFALAVQVLHFTLNIDVTQNLIISVVSVLISLPSVCGLYALYFSKQLRSNMQYFAKGLFAVAVAWNILRLTETVVIPVLQDYGFGNAKLLNSLQTFVGINDEISFFLFVAALIGLIVYTYYCGNAVRKMPEKKEN